MPKKPIKFRELCKKLKKYGVEKFPSKRGKGSEVLFLLPDPPGSKQGPQYPVKHHGDGTEISIGVITALLRRFDIDPDDFWK